MSDRTDTYPITRPSLVYRTCDCGARIDRETGQCPDCDSGLMFPECMRPYKQPQVDAKDNDAKH
jgi:predicted ATP-dependent serine protease